MREGVESDSVPGLDLVHLELIVVFEDAPAVDESLARGLDVGLCGDGGFELGDGLGGGDGDLEFEFRGAWVGGDGRAGEEERVGRRRIYAPVVQQVRRAWRSR